MFVIEDRKTLALDLRTYGEDALARRVLSLDVETLARIQERAGHYLYTGENGLIAKAVTLAAIEVLEGTARQPRWKRRKLKGIWPEQPLTKPKSHNEPHMTSREAENAIAAGLKEAGYKKAPRETRIFLKPLTEDITGWVGCALYRTRSGEIEITATVGVRHNRHHDLIDRLRPHKQPSSEATAVINLGYLLPENTANMVWRLDCDTPPDEVATGLANYIVRYGEPWMRARITREAIIEQLRHDQRGPRPIHPQRLPVALLLAGRFHEAREALDVELNKIAGQTDPAAEAFRQFAERFQAELQTHATYN